MADHELWLKLGRTVVTERGFGFTHVPGKVSKFLLDPLDSTLRYAIEPVTGYACCVPVFSLDDAYDWDTDADHYQTGSHLGVTWPVHVGAAEFRAETTEALTYGHGFNLAFLVYWTSGPLTVEFGGQDGELPRFKLVLSTMLAELYRGDQVVDFGCLWTADEWVGKPLHLSVYQVGRRLVVVRPGFAGLLTYQMPAQEPDGPFGDPDTIEALLGPLQPGTIVVKGTGHTAFQAGPERHGTELAFEHEVIKLPEPVTTEPTTELTIKGPPAALPEGWTEEDPEPERATLELLTADGFPLYPEPEEGEEEEPVTVTSFFYRVTGQMASATGPNLYIPRVRIHWPPKLDADGLTGTNLLGLAGASLQKVTERLSIDGRSNGLGFEILANRGQLSPYVQPNMTLLWKPFGVSRFWGFTSRPTCHAEGAGDVLLERLSFDCEGLDKRFRDSYWTGEGSFGGRLLSEAYAGVVRKAGFDETEIEVYAGGYELPAEQDDGPALFDFRPDQRLEDILFYLRDQFGAEDILRFRPDGKFHAEEPTTTASGYTFYFSTPAEEVRFVCDGTSTMPRVLRGSWDERLSEEGFANVVAVVGEDEAEHPLVAMMTDWSSINDPTASNYYGCFKPLVIVDAGLTTQEAVNWVCAQTYRRVTVPRVTANFRGMYVPALVPGEIVGLDGRGNWRILSMQTDWEKNQPKGLTGYEVEAVG